MSMWLQGQILPFQKEKAAYASREGRMIWEDDCLCCRKQTVASPWNVDDNITYWVVKSKQVT